MMKNKRIVQEVMANTLFVGTEGDGGYYLKLDVP